MRAGESPIPAGELRKQAGVSCSVHRSFDPISGLGRRFSCSGFGPAGVVEGATGLPVGLYKDFRSVYNRSKLAPCACKGFSTGNLFSPAQA